MKLLLIFIFLINHIGCQSDIPKYLSIEINKTDYSHEIYEFLQDNIFHILTEYRKHSQVKIDFDELFETHMTHLFEPKTWHITVLNFELENIKEKKYKKLDSDIYKNFIEKKELEINISTLIYVPGKIMVAPVFFNDQIIENRIPHITFILGEKFRPIDGNYLLKSLLIENKELKSLYDEGFIKDPSFQINLELNNIRILYEDKKKQEILDYVYIIKYDSHLKLKGITKKIYE